MCFSWMSGVRCGSVRWSGVRWGGVKWGGVVVWCSVVMWRCDGVVV